jgi:streptomycin 6-kinase
MSATFNASLPRELITHVTSMCGQRGVQWLEGLEEMVIELERLWSIKVGAPFPAGEYNFVAPAQRTGGKMAVVKLSPPFATVEIFGEAAFLRSRNGSGAVKLIDEDPSRFAILIEHAHPGKNLTELFADNKAAAVEPAIEVLHSILSPVPAGSDIVTLDKWFEGLTRHHETNFPSDYAVKALRIYDELSRQRDRTFYLHGDFHPGNVVSATRAPFLAIDPKGIAGHVGYEIAVFLNNFHWWQEKMPDIRTRLNAVMQFANAFELDPPEIRQWAFAQMVLGAWWTFEDMPELYGNEVAKADIWDV